MAADQTNRCKELISGTNDAAKQAFTQALHLCTKVIQEVLVQREDQ